MDSRKHSWILVWSFSTVPLTKQEYKTTIKVELSKVPRKIGAHWLKKLMLYTCLLEKRFLLKRCTCHDLMWQLSLMKVCILNHKNDKVNNWSQEIHAINPHVEFEHIKRKENIFSWQFIKAKTLGLYETNIPEKEEHGIWQICFQFRTRDGISVYSNWKVNQEFEINGIKYQLHTAHEDDLLPPDTALKPKLLDPPQCKLDLSEVK